MKKSHDIGCCLLAAREDAPVVSVNQGAVGQQLLHLPPVTDAGEDAVASASRVGQQTPLGTSA